MLDALTLYLDSARSSLEAWPLWGQVLAVIAVVTPVVILLRKAIGLWDATVGKRRHNRTARAERAKQQEREQRLDTEAEKTRELLHQILGYVRPDHPGQIAAIKEAVVDARSAATAGDARMIQALSLLQDGNQKEAEPLFRAVAEEKAARVRSDSKEAAVAFRHLGAIAGLGDPKTARMAYARAVAPSIQRIGSPSTGTVTWR